MKRIIIFAALAAFALTSCQQELTIEENKPEVAVFTATTEIPTTKTALDASLNVIWQDNDQIAIMSNSAIGIYKTTTGGATNATFVYDTQTEATVSPFKAWYPTTLFSGTTFVLPATQTYVAGNISVNPMYAESSTTNLSFKNLCGIIKLNISTTQTGKKVRKIVLSANQGMSGEISNAATLATDLAAVVSGTAGVTLDCGTEGVEIGSTAIPFYIAVPANTYSNLKISVVTKDGEIQTRSATSGIEVVRSKITDITLGFGKLTATTGSAAITGGGTQEWVQLWAGGPKWAKFNVGSSISSYAGATAYTTSTIGGYYSFHGRNDCSPDVNGTNDTAKYHWGDNWTTPSLTQMQALIDNCTWTYCDGSEVQFEAGCTLAGWKVSGKDAGYTENAIFLPFAGTKDSNQFGMDRVGTRGCFWSSDPYNDGYGNFLELFAAFKGIVYHDKSHGCSVRAILNPALEALFSVSSTTKVTFSPGNLQYYCSTSAPEWRFAEHQYDYVAFDGSAYAENSGKWIDLFAYGTSGYNNGQTCYQPYSTSGNAGDYYQNALTGNADWGYNKISNGGNTENQWRTLTSSEWQYLFQARTNSDQKYGHGRVNGVNGMILLPDNWTLPDGLSFTSGNSAWVNVYDTDQWLKMERAGAVFLPASGSRAGNTLPTPDQENGYYRSSTPAYYIWISSNKLQVCTNVDTYFQYGDAVRLVRNVN